MKTFKIRIVMSSMIKLWFTITAPNQDDALLALQQELAERKRPIYSWMWDVDKIEVMN